MWQMWSKEGRGTNVELRLRIIGEALSRNVY